MDALIQSLSIMDTQTSDQEVRVNLARIKFEYVLLNPTSSNLLQAIDVRNKKVDTTYRNLEKLSLNARRHPST